jgi:serine protease
MRLSFSFATLAAIAVIGVGCSTHSASTVPAPQQGVPGSSERLVQTGPRTAVDLESGAGIHGALSRSAAEAPPAVQPAGEARAPESGGIPAVTPTPTPSPTPIPNLSYYGGPVQTSPKVYAVYWGSQWLAASPAPHASPGAGDPYNVRAFSKSFLNAIFGSVWLKDVVQYTQSNGQHAGNPAGAFIGSYTDKSSTLTGTKTYNQTAAEAIAAAAHFGVSGVNVEIVVFLPTGIGAHNLVLNGGPWCAYHSWVRNSSNQVIPYIVMPYTPDAGANCGANYFSGAGDYGALDGVGFLLGHEVAETITDPKVNGTAAPTAWTDVDNNEIGDKCEWLDNALDVDAGGYPVQSLWNNSRNSCRLHHGGT